MQVVFIIDNVNSLIVKNFTQKIILKEILVKVSNSLIKFINRLISNLYGGSSLTVEYRPVEPKERVRFPPAALFKNNKLYKAKTNKVM